MWYELEDQGGIKIISKMVLKWKLLEVKFHSITKRDHQIFGKILVHAKDPRILGS